MDTLLTHGLHNTCESNVVDDDLGHFREMPSVPLLNPHGVYVNLLVQIVEQSDSLDNHSVDLVGGELKLEPGKRVTKTKRHGVEIFLVNAAEKRGELLTDTTVEVLGGGVREDGDGESFVDGTGCVASVMHRSGSNTTIMTRPTQLGIRDNQHLLNLLLLLLLFAIGTANSVKQKLGERVCQSSVLDSGEIFNGRCCGCKSLNGLDLQTASKLADNLNR